MCRSAGIPRRCTRWPSRPALFPTLVPWLALHRADLSVLLHPETGRQRADHTSHALWMGLPLPLKAEILPE